MKMTKNIKIISVSLISGLFAYFSQAYMLNDGFGGAFFAHFDFWLFLLCLGFFAFVFAHIFVPISKLYEFLYKNRFKLALCLFVVLMLGKFHGSSYGMWNEYIEPNYPVASLKPIVGVSRAIRSDEWLVNTSYVLSQLQTGMQSFNPVMRATPTDIFTTVPAPIKSPLILVKPFLIGFLFLGKDYGMSFYWWARIIALFLVTFEVFMILTHQKRRYALLGAVLLTFSPAIFWWYSQYLIEELVGGFFAVLMFYHFLRAKNIRQKIGYSLLLGWGFSVYLFTLYPAWIVPLGYFFLLLAVYFLWDYYQDKKFHFKDLAFLFLPIFLVLFFVVFFFSQSYSTYQLITNTVYPGHRLFLGNDSIQLLFSYPSNIFFPYSDVSNASEFSTFYSLFPMSFFLMGYYLVKTLKKLKEHVFLVGLFALIIFFLCATVLPLPSFLAKISLLSMTTGIRLNLILSLLLTIGLVLVFADLSVKDWKEKLLLGLVMIFGTVFTLWMTKNVVINYMSPLKLVLSFGIIILPLLGMLSSKKYVKCGACIFLIFTSIFSIIYVNPLMKGLNGVYEKPISKTLSSYQKEDATWASLDSFVIPNYLGLHGLKVINATNVYPNLELWYKLDPDKKFMEIYNRYAHIILTLNTETTFVLRGSDLIEVQLKPEDLCTLDVDYVSALNPLETYSNEIISFTKEYENDNIYLYKTNCKGGES